MTLKNIVLFSFKVIILSLILVSTSICQSKAYKGAEVYGKSDYYIQYGKIEVRMMAAKGGGILSTFFTWKEGSEQSSVFWEEIDVEIFGKNNAATWQTNIITGFDPRRTSEQVHNENFSLGDDFHTYSVEWTPEYVSWSIDGQQVRRTSGQPATDITNPAGIRFNLWASTSTSWVGPFNDSVLPQYQFVNWIKYYSYDDGMFTLDWEDDFTNFDNNLWGKANWTFDGNRVDFEPQNAVVQNGMLILCLTKAGETGFSGTVPQDSADISTGQNDSEGMPNSIELLQSYPNPFNPTTTISFSLSSQTHVSLKIFDVTGKEVANLINDNFKAGNFSVTFDAGQLSSGIYFYKVTANNFTQTRKMMLLK